MRDVEKAEFPDSTAVRAIRYFVGQRVLQVTFASGAVYDYFGVPPDVYDRFSAADSAGGFLNEEILDRYRFERRR